MSKKCKIINFNGKELTLKELTVSDVRNLIGVEAVDYVDAFLIDDITLTELAFMAGISVNDLSSATSEDLIALREAAKEVNPLFFGLKERLGKVAEKMRQSYLIGQSAP